MSLIENKIIVLDSLFVEESEVQHNQVFPLDLGGEVKTKYYFSEELTSEAIVSLDFLLLRKIETLSLWFLQKNSHPKILR